MRRAATAGDMVGTPPGSEKVWILGAQIHD